MNKNLKTGALVALAASAGLTSCSRYEEGPMSLRSPKARLAGEWELVECEDDDTQDFIDDGGQIIMEFDKDGDIKYSISGEITTQYYSYYWGWTTFTYEFDYDVKGDWEFENKKKEIEIEIGGDKVEFDIIRLSKKEMILEDPDKNQWEFEKQ